MGIEDDFEYTIKEISEELNISKEKCRQVLLMAIKKFKNSNHKEKWKDIKETIEEIDNAYSSQ